MPCTGSLKSGDSIMLSCLSPRRPCCGPNAAVSLMPAAESASSECARPPVTDAGCASNATRRPASGLRSALSASSRSMPNFIELQSEGVLVMEVRLAGRVAQRPVRQRAVGLFDDRRQANAQSAFFVKADLRAEIEPARRALHADLRIGPDERHALAIAREAVGRPLARGREIE